MRHKGDITDWINWGISQGMEPKKFIEQLERAIHAAVDARKHSQSQQQPDNIDDVDAEKVVKLPKEWALNEYDPTTSTLFGSYCHHCRQSNLNHQSNNNFSANLLELLQQTLGWEVEKKKTNKGRVIIGVRLRTPQDNDIPYLDEILAKSDDPE